MLVSDFPIYDTPNYAPVRPLLELSEKREPNQNDVVSQIRQKYEELNKREEGLFNAIAETAFTISAFTQGKQAWQRNWYRGGSWELALPDAKANPNLTRSFNKMQFQVSQALEDIISSNPDFEPADMFKSFEHEKQVKAAKATWNHYEKKFYDGSEGSWFNIQQAHSLITSGTAIEELIYDASLKSINVFKEIWGEQEVEIYPGGGRCFSCEFAGQYEDFHQWDNANAGKEYAEIGEAAKAGDAEAQGAMNAQPLAGWPQCPECGSFETELSEPERESIPSVVGLEQYQLGDFRLNNLAIQACRYDVAVRPELSSYFIDKQYFPLNKIKKLFGRNVAIGEHSESDVGLDYLHKMARIGASIGGARVTYDNKADRKATTLCRMSLSLDELADIDIPSSGDLQTISGDDLPSGKTLADVCQAAGAEGGTVLGFNGMQHVYGIYAVHHKTRIASTFYFSKANSGTGRGMEDTTEIQKRVNRIDAQQVAAVDGASPGYAFVEGSVDEKHVKRMGFPNAKIPIVRNFFNLTRDISKIVKQFDPQQVAPQFFVYAAELEKMMQMTAHNISMSGSVFDADNKTATGARILEATAQAITIPILQCKASCRQGTIKNLLQGVNVVFASVKRSFSLGMGGNKHFSKVEVSGDQINPEIEFVVVENSMIPQNYYTRKVDYLSFANAVNTLAPEGGYFMLKEADPEMLKIYSKAFGVDIGNDEYDQITEICRARMENGIELMDIMAGVAEDLAAAMAAAPMEPMPEEPIAEPPVFAEPEIVHDGAAPTSDLPLTAEQDGNSMVAAAPEPLNTPENIIFDLIFASLDVPIRPGEKNHQQKADWFRDFLDTPDGLALEVAQRDLLFEFIFQHENAGRTNTFAGQAADMMGALAATAPATVVQTKVGQMTQAGEPQEPGAGKPKPKK